MHTSITLLWCHTFCRYWPNAQSWTYVIFWFSHYSPYKIESVMSSLTADQWKNWTCVYSLYALHDVLPKDHLHCWCLFVHACTLISRPLLIPTVIDKADELLMSCCRIWAEWSWVMYDQSASSWALSRLFVWLRASSLYLVFQFWVIFWCQRKASLC